MDHCRAYYVLLQPTFLEWKYFLCVSHFFQRTWFWFNPVPEIRGSQWKKIIYIYKTRNLPKLFEGENYLLRKLRKKCPKNMSLYILIGPASAGCYKIGVVGSNWLVGNAVFSETAVRIFLIFCIKLGNYKGRKVTEPDFWKKFLIWRLMSSCFLTIRRSSQYILVEINSRSQKEISIHLKKFHWV